MVVKNDRVGIKKMFFFLNLDFPYRRHQNVYFDIVSADVVYPPGESYPYLLIFAPIEDFIYFI